MLLGTVALDDIHALACFSSFASSPCSLCTASSEGLWATEQGVLGLPVSPLSLLFSAVHSACLAF